MIDRNVVWHGPEVPAFVPLHAGAATLDLLDTTASGTMALYRDHDLGSPPMQPLCGMDSKDEKGADMFPGAKKNCAAEVRLYDRAGTELAALPLAPFLSRTDHLEVQDAHYDGGTLYFNEACQSYSRNAGGRCSSLVAVDPIAKRVLWRTPSLTSNNAFAMAGEYIVTAYGFTSERSSIRLVRRRDGAIVDTKPLPSAADDALTVQGDVVSVNLYNMLGRVQFRITGAGGPSPKLAPIATSAATEVSGRRALAERR
ncbi:MAG: uncharacterized protein JWM74_4612 [Myxococcaceae bacterium]|nr:uncharacterized protein [Myxococcaceae bacterium]